MGSSVKRKIKRSGNGEVAQTRLEVHPILACTLEQSFSHQIHNQIGHPSVLFSKVSLQCMIYHWYLYQYLYYTVEGLPLGSHVDKVISGILVKFCNYFGPDKKISMMYHQWVEYEVCIGSQMATGEEKTRIEILRKNVFKCRPHWDKWHFDKLTWTYWSANSWEPTRPAIVILCWSIV